MKLAFFFTGFIIFVIPLHGMESGTSTNILNQSMDEIDTLLEQLENDVLFQEVKKNQQQATQPKENLLTNTAPKTVQTPQTTRSRKSRPRRQQSPNPLLLQKIKEKNLFTLNIKDIPTLTFDQIFEHAKSTKDPKIKEKLEKEYIKRCNILLNYFGESHKDIIEECSTKLVDTIISIIHYHKHNFFYHSFDEKKLAEVPEPLKEILVQNQNKYFTQQLERLNNIPQVIVTPATKNSKKHKSSPKPIKYAKKDAPSTQSKPLPVIIPVEAAEEKITVVLNDVSPILQALQEIRSKTFEPTVIDIQNNSIEYRQAQQKQQKLYKLMQNIYAPSKVSSKKSFFISLLTFLSLSIAVVGIQVAFYYIAFAIQHTEFKLSRLLYHSCNKFL